MQVRRKREGNPRFAVVLCLLKLGTLYNVHLLCSPASDWSSQSAGPLFTVFFRLPLTELIETCSSLSAEMVLLHFEHPGSRAYFAL